MIILRSGFLAAVDSVQAFLDSYTIDATVQVGWKERPRRDNKSPSGANRVVFEPSGKGGAGGSIEPAIMPGNRNVRVPLTGAVEGTVRSLRNWRRKAVVSVWAVDNAAREDEAAQIEATESLFEWVIRALHNAPGAFASVLWGDVEWTEPVQRSFGLELRAGFEFSHPIFDVPRAVAFPTTALVRRADQAPATKDTPGGDT